MNNRRTGRKEGRFGPYPERDIYCAQQHLQRLLATNHNPDVHQVLLKIHGTDLTYGGYGGYDRVRYISRPLFSSESPQRSSMSQRNSLYSDSNATLTESSSCSRPSTSSATAAAGRKEDLEPSNIFCIDRSGSSESPQRSSMSQRNSLCIDSNTTLTESSSYSRPSTSSATAAAGRKEDLEPSNLFCIDRSGSSESPQRSSMCQRNSLCIDSNTTLTESSSYSRPSTSSATAAAGRKEDLQPSNLFRIDWSGSSESPQRSSMSQHNSLCIDSNTTLTESSSYSRPSTSSATAAAGRKEDLEPSNFFRIDRSGSSNTESSHLNEQTRDRPYQEEHKSKSIVDIEDEERRVSDAQVEENDVSSSVIPLVSVSDLEDGEIEDNVVDGGGNTANRGMTDMLVCDLCSYYVNVDEKSLMKRHLRNQSHYGASLLRGYLYGKEFKPEFCIKEIAVKIKTDLATLVPICPMCCDIYPSIWTCGVHWNRKHPNSNVTDVYGIGVIQETKMTMINRAFFCQICDTKFETQKALHKHWRSTVSHLPYELPTQDQVTIFCCFYCGAIFSDFILARMHCFTAHNNRNSSCQALKVLYVDKTDTQLVLPPLLRTTNMHTDWFKLAKQEAVKEGMCKKLVQNRFGKETKKRKKKNKRKKLQGFS